MFEYKLTYVYINSEIKSNLLDTLIVAKNDDNNKIHALYSILTQLVVKGFEFSCDDVIRDDRFSF